jgi:polyisoprenoid-binding protein YceI
MARVRKPVVWIGAAVVVVALVVVVAPFVYIHWIKDDAPPRLALPSVSAGGTVTTSAGTTATTGSTATPSTTGIGTADAPSTTAAPAAAGSGSAAPGDLSGTWTPTADSVAGYRVKEVLFGQSTEGVGRTSDVSGQLTIAGTTVSVADFSVDLTTVESDSNQRDNQFQGRIMDTSQYPTATFTLTQPIDLGSVPAEGQQVSVSAVGDLTMRGTTKSVTIPLTAQLSGGTIQVQGALDLVFADWGIPNPSFGPASTEDHGILEFLLVFAR